MNKVWFIKNTYQKSVRYSGQITCLFVSRVVHCVPYKPHCVPSVMNIMMAGGRTQMPTRKSARLRERMNWLVTVRSFGVVSTAMMIRAFPSCKIARMKGMMNNSRGTRTHLFICLSRHRILRLPETRKNYSTLVFAGDISV